MQYTGDTLRIGGRLDTLTKKYVGPCDRWRVWLVGEQQMRIIRDFVERRKPRNRLLYSAEGAGKTVLMAMLGWLSIMLAVTEGVFGALGATAPTHPRLSTLTAAFCDLGPVSSSRERVPGAWGTFFVDAGDLRTVSGHVIQLRATKKQSGETGSPIQGWNWGLGALMDEVQDSTSAYEDVVARLRSGEEPPIVATATAKDHPRWRNWRDSRSKNWRIERITYRDTPWVHDSHWELLKDECTDREWQRRGLAMDVAPEKAVYTTWERSENLAPVPQIGAEDVTREILAPWGDRYSLLLGHDPGKIVDVTVVLKAYRIGTRVCWWVVDEVTTERTTTEEHIEALLARLRGHWRVNLLDRKGLPSQNGPQALVRADPYSNSSNDSNRPDRSVYTIFRNAGISILPAALVPDPHKVKTATIPKEARINMVCRLFRNTNGLRRLFIATDDRGAPVAPRLVEAIELSERDGDGNAEAQKKTTDDLSHWPAALGYALWSLERPKLGVSA